MGGRAAGKQRWMRRGERGTRKTNLCPRPRLPAPRPRRHVFQRGFDSCLRCFHQSIPPSSLHRAPFKAEKKRGISRGRSCRKRLQGQRPRRTCPPHLRARSVSTSGPEHTPRTMFHQIAGFNKSAWEGTQQPSVGETLHTLPDVALGPGAPLPSRCHSCHGHRVSATEHQSARVLPAFTRTGICVARLSFLWDF